MMKKIHGLISSMRMKRIQNDLLYTYEKILNFHIGDAKNHLTII